MLSKIAKKIIGTANERALRPLEKKVEQIQDAEPAIRDLNDEQLKAKTEEFKSRLHNGESTDDILVEAFCVCREASRRVMKMRHFDVQLIGGMVLQSGRIAEMRTGEGKTLVATLAVYLSALEGKGVHVVTVNDYLARRDAEEMRPLYSFLGLTTGIILPGMSQQARRAAYNCDITYATNNELGFDYLRDNMQTSTDDKVQRPFHHAIIDEVDSILIDEARTPLIISGPSDLPVSLYSEIDAIATEIFSNPENYEKDEKARTVILTEKGIDAVQNALRSGGIMPEGELYDAQNANIIHHVQQALRAHTLFSKDVDYLVRDDKVLIIDESTGRIMDGRRYSDGLHQALEAKEKTEIQPETQTLASITYQNFFRLYPKISGMTGTASTEADELNEVYDLAVIEIPTNRPVQRKDHDDLVFMTKEEKFKAILDLVRKVHGTGQPILIGTASVEQSEHLSDLMKREGIDHQVLNARVHAQESRIIAQAGAPKAVTIATNMAGRGTDIKLGGSADLILEDMLFSVSDDDERQAIISKVTESIGKKREEVRKKGGLYVIGSERHDSRRVDNQLRGRSGRQGDPGTSQFFVSLEDDLMRVFGTNLQGIMKLAGVKPGEAVCHPKVSSAVSKTQQKIEAHNATVRSHTLKYDNVINAQRKMIYQTRAEYLQTEDPYSIIKNIMIDHVVDLFEHFMPEKNFQESWDTDGLTKSLLSDLKLDFPIRTWLEDENVSSEGIRRRIYTAFDDRHNIMTEEMGGPELGLSTEIERMILVTSLDSAWKEHLSALDHLKSGIMLRAYAQKDPLREYTLESAEMHQDMLDNFAKKTLDAAVKADTATEIPS